MISRTGRVAAVLTVAVFTGVGCAGGEPPAAPVSSTPVPPPPPAEPPPSAEAAPFTLTDLTSRPCRVVEALETEIRPAAEPEELDEAWLEAKSCQWQGSFLGVLVFTPFPSVDRTADRELAGQEHREVGGHPAVVARGQEPGVCHVYVSLGDGRSMRVIRGPVIDADVGIRGACEEAVEVAGQVSGRIV